MSRVTGVLLALGTALFVALLAWQGIGSVAAVLAIAGWGLVVVTAFHFVPLVVDAAAIVVMLDRGTTTWRDVLIARWVGESVNSLLPAGQLGGPVLMVRYLAQRGVAMREAAAAITVSTTLQMLAQIGFAIFGIALFVVGTRDGELADLGTPIAVATGALTAIGIAFYAAQRHGMFGRLARLAAKVFGRRDGTALNAKADDIDLAVGALYGRRHRVAASFVLSLAGWLVGTGEVWLALHFLGHPVGLLEVLLLESVGQAIRGAAFAIPGSLGVQEGGYLLLAPLVGLPPDIALALSLAKRARELALGLPGLVWLHWNERRSRRLPGAALPAVD